MKNFYPHLVLPFFLAVLLQGCVVPAAVDAMKHYTDYEVVKTKQVDENNFYTIVAVTHSRGVFDPLAGHGNPFVTTRVDLQLWHLSLADKNILVKKADEMVFKTENELANWQRVVQRLEIDLKNSRLIRPSISTQASPHIVYLNNLRIDSEKNTVESTVNGHECLISAPSNILQTNWNRTFLVSNDESHLMIVDSTNKNRQAKIFDLCNSTQPKLELAVPLDRVLGFSVYPNGSLKWLQGTFYNGNAALGEQTTYEVLLYPKQEFLVVNEKNLGLPKSFNSPKDFLFNESSKRFYWVAIANQEVPNFIFITHDFKTGLTQKRESVFK